MQLADQLYFYPWQGRANNCNSYLLKGSLNILFDPGHVRTDLGESCLEDLVGRLSADGTDISEIDLVLCTHGHPDHVDAAAWVCEKSGAGFGLHRGDKFILDFFAGQSAPGLGGGGEGATYREPDFYLEEGELSLPGGKELTEKIEVLHTPGHSPGCVCFYLPRVKALISGDTIFEGSIGRADLPGGSMETLAQSVEKIEGLQEVELLLPGHMGCVQGAGNVRRNLEKIRRYFFR